MYFTLPYPFPALSLLEAAKPDRVGKISPSTFQFKLSQAEDKQFCTIHAAIPDIRRRGNGFLYNVIFYQGAWFIGVLFFLLQRSVNLFQKKTEKR